jgi:hypothetical protein
VRRLKYRPSQVGRDQDDRDCEREILDRAVEVDPLLVDSGRPDLDQLEDRRHHQRAAARKSISDWTLAAVRSNR